MRTLIAYLILFANLWGMSANIEGNVTDQLNSALVTVTKVEGKVKILPASSIKKHMAAVDELEELNKDSAKEGLPEIEIGVGLNTAEVVVGNMGSEKRFYYTVIGDGVNLAPRVEGINKSYGTHVLITEFTQAIVKDEFLTRPIEKVRVKGKEAEVLLYELLKDTQSNREMQEALNGFESLGDDSVSRYFAQRIKDDV